MVHVKSPLIGMRAKERAALCQVHRRRPKAAVSQDWTVDASPRTAWNVCARRMKCAALTCGTRTAPCSHWGIAMVLAVNVPQVRSAAIHTSHRIVQTTSAQTVCVPRMIPAAPLGGMMTVGRLPTDAISVDACRETDALKPWKQRVPRTQRVIRAYATSIPSAAMGIGPASALSSLALPATTLVDAQMEALPTPVGSYGIAQPNAHSETRNATTIVDISVPWKRRRSTGPC